MNLQSSSNCPPNQGVPNNAAQTRLVNPNHSCPTNYIHTGPCSFCLGGPSNVGRAGSSNVGHAGLSNAGQGVPSNVSQRPINAGQGIPSRVGPGLPSNVCQGGPSNIGQAGLSNSAHAGTSNANRVAPNEAIPAGPSNSGRAGPSNVNRTAPGNADRGGPSSANRAAPTQASTVADYDYVGEEVARRPLNGKGSDATEPYCESETIKKLCKENYPQYELPRLARCGNSMLGITYRYSIVKGKFSLHHAWRWADKKIFSAKLDRRGLELVKWDQHVRSKLVKVDLPRVIHAERQDKHCLTIMEPMSVSWKWYMHHLVKTTKNADLYYGTLLRIGRQCIRYLQSLHQSGFLHGNINPQTFVFPTKVTGKEGKPDFERGPLIIDYGYATNWKQDPIYKQEAPEKYRNNALFARDGGMYTRRDDMENLGYLLLYMTKASLRWEPRTQREFVMFGKKCLSDLNKFVKGIPLRIKQYLSYIRILKWNEEPDYRLLDDILGNTKVDIQKEIKIRRGRRTAAKQRLKRQRRAEERANLIAASEGRTGQAQTSHKKRKVCKKDEKKKRVSFEDRKGSPEEPISKSEHSPLHVPAPQDTRTSALLQCDHANEEKEGLPTCPYCSKNHHNPTVVQGLDLKKCSEEEYKEGLEYGRPDPIITENCEQSKMGPISDTMDRSKIVEEIDPCEEDFEEDLEYDSDASMIEDVLITQDALPSRELETTRKVKRPSPVTKAVVPCDKPGSDINFNFPYLPWETDSEQIHPWESEIGNLVSLHLPFDSQAVDYPMPSSRDSVVDLSKVRID